MAEEQTDKELEKAVLRLAADIVREIFPEKEDEPKILNDEDLLGADIEIED